MRRCLWLVAGLLVGCGSLLGGPPPSPGALPELRSGALTPSPGSSGQLAAWPAGQVAVVEHGDPPQRVGRVEAAGRWAFTLAEPSSSGPADLLAQLAGPAFGEVNRTCALDALRGTPPDTRVQLLAENDLLIRTEALQAQLGPVPLRPGLTRADLDVNTRVRRQVCLAHAAQEVQVQGQRVCRVYPWTGSPVNDLSYRRPSTGLMLSTSS